MLHEKLNLVSLFGVKQTQLVSQGSVRGHSFLTKMLPTDRRFTLLAETERRVFCRGNSLQTPHHRHTMQKDLLPPAGQRKELQRHSVALYADLHSPLRTVHLLLLSEATLVLLQQADAFLIAALQRTNHSSANDLTSCVQTAFHTRTRTPLEAADH